MKKQRVFNFDFDKINNNSELYLNKTNIHAYDGITNLQDDLIYLRGTAKSGKSILAEIWIEKNKGIIYNNNFEYVINNKKNILIDNLDISFDHEKIFHVLNHCKFNSSKILITSNYDINEINFPLNDLISRLKTFTYLKINQPDDDMLINILTKFFVEKQFVIYSKDIFQYIIKNTDRTYANMYNIVNKLDTLSLEKKRQLTIPLIKEIL